MLASQGHGLNYIVNGSRNNDSDGNLAVIGSVGGIKRAAAFIEANFPGDASAQIFSQGIGPVAGKCLISSWS
jgi:hypothetical protein